MYYASAETCLITAFAVSHKFGYGLMDGEGMVDLASSWKTVPTQRKCDSPEDNTQK